MGGSDENWSFFLHEDFANGTSTANMSTFQKCWLAGETKFKPKNVELWQIGERKPIILIDDMDEIEQQKVQTKQREAKLMLELSGKTMHGEVYREEDKSSQ